MSADPAPPAVAAKQGMSRGGFAVRLALCVAIDVLDFTVGRLMFPIPWEEGFGAAVLVLLWGWTGLLYLWELADLSELIDGFVPTATLVGLVHGWRKGLLFPAAPGG